MHKDYREKLSSPKEQACKGSGRKRDGYFKCVLGTDFMRRSLEQRWEDSKEQNIQEKKIFFFFLVQSPVAYWVLRPSKLWWKRELPVPFQRDGRWEDEQGMQGPGFCSSPLHTAFDQSTLGQGLHHALSQAHLQLHRQRLGRNPHSVHHHQEPHLIFSDQGPACTAVGDSSASVIGGLTA